jgi:hypothetical protein
MASLGAAFPEAKFPLGQLLVTRGAQEVLTAADMKRALFWHSQGSWGEVSEEDAAENDFSVPRRLRILSAYVADEGTRFWVITEADRSATTILLPEEY